MEKGKFRPESDADFTPADRAWFDRGERQSAAGADTPEAQPVGGERFSELEKAWFQVGEAPEPKPEDLPLWEEYQGLVEKMLEEQPDRPDAEALRYKLEKATENIDKLRRDQLSEAREAVQTASEGPIEVVDLTAEAEVIEDESEPPVAASERKLPPRAEA
jgi:hypothetical protein